jgi:hypothetical protein
MENWLSRGFPLRRVFITRLLANTIRMSQHRRLERVLGSANMHASSKVFVDGNYRFPVEQNSTPGYITPSCLFIVIRSQIRSLFTDITL